MTSNTLTRIVLLALLLTSVGCIGIQNAPDVFLNQPTPGMNEVEMIKTYGMPDYTHKSGDTTVYVYQVNNRAYYVVYGFNNDVDMVVVCKAGKVVEVKNVKSGDGMSILQPNTWNVNG